MDQAIAQRLQHLDEGQIEILRRLDVAERERGQINETLRDVVVEIGGVPDEIGRDPQRRSIRRRLHEIEADRSAAQAGRAAVDAATKIYDAATERRFSRREKLAGLAFAFVVAVGPYIAPFLH